MPVDRVLAKPVADLGDSASQHGDYVASLLVHLPERERQVITLRYGFADGEARSNDAVAALLGLTPARVEELDRQARHRLRKALQFLVPHRGAGSASREGGGVAQTSKFA